MAQSECNIVGCGRIAQISGLMKGYCCSLCGVTDPARHAVICDMIEESGNAELGEQDNIVLGYN